MMLVPSKTKAVSTLSRCISLIHKANVILTPIFEIISAYPPFKIPTSSFIIDLQNHLKHNISSCEYTQLLNKTLQPYDGWEVIYIDGPKSATNTTFAVRNRIGGTIAVGALPTYCSAFTAEAAALLEAVMYASRIGSKHIICIDSKSSVEAILNPTVGCHCVAQIREILLQYSSIKIMWIPGHAGITGNEIVDKRAKEAGTEPMHLFDYFINRDVRKLYKQILHESWLTEWDKDVHY